MSWLCIANLFPPDLWGYVHEFGYQTKGLIAPLAYYALHMPMEIILDLVKVWQISFHQTLLGCVHRFGYKLGITLKSQLTMKAQSLEATLPAIIFICGVYMSLLKQNITRKERVYKNTTRRTQTLLLCHIQDVQDIQDIWERECYNKRYKNATR